MFHSLKSSQISKVIDAPISLLIICLMVWNLNYLIIHSVGNVIIPTDELIFFRGVGIPPYQVILCYAGKTGSRSIHWQYPSSHILHWNSFVVFAKLASKSYLDKGLQNWMDQSWYHWPFTGFWIGGPNHIHQAYFWGLNFREYPQKIWPYIWY